MTEQATGPDRPTGPDVGQLAAEKLPQIEFPGGKGESFRIFIEPQTHEEIWKYAKEDTTVEICGVLVGVWGSDGDGPFALISASIRGAAAANKFAEVTFTHETWATINAEMDGKYSDRAIVGWYHTHPDFGIFLSDRDRFIQENFFSSPGQIALVIDPVRKIEGAFIWRDGKTALADHYWIGNRVQIGIPDEQGAKGESAGGAGAAASAAPAARVSPWLQMLPTVLQYVLVFLIGWLLAGHVNDGELRRTAIEAEAATYYQYCLRPDLDKQIDDVRKGLAILDDETQQMEKDHLEWMGKAGGEGNGDLIKNRQEAWAKLRDSLTESRHRLDLIKHDYCLKPEQREFFEQLRSRMLQENIDRIAREQEELKAKQDAESAAAKEKEKGTEKPADQKPADQKPGEPKSSEQKKPADKAAGK